MSSCDPVTKQVLWDDNLASAELVEVELEQFDSLYSLNGLEDFLCRKLTASILQQSLSLRRIHKLRRLKMVGTKKTVSIKIRCIFLQQILSARPNNPLLASTKVHPFRMYTFTSTTNVNFGHLKKPTAHSKGLR